MVGDLAATPEKFDNQYFNDLMNGRGFLNSDQTLFMNARTRGYVRAFSQSERKIFQAFVNGMIKLGDLQSGKPGEIRRNCRVVTRKVDIFLEY